MAARATARNKREERKKGELAHKAKSDGGTGGNAGEERKEGTREERRPGKGARPTHITTHHTPHALHHPHPQSEATYTVSHSVQPGRGCPHTPRGS